MEYRREDESNIPDRYLGTRLLDLYNELREARPRGISQWVQARAKERHFMIVTIAGALSAVLALALAMVQAWVYCQQWKHPVNISSASAEVQIEKEIRNCTLIWLHCFTS
jgi:hypothetical protein